MIKKEKQIKGNFKLLMEPNDETDVHVHVFRLRRQVYGLYGRTNGQTYGWTDMDIWKDGNKDEWSGIMICAFRFKKAKLWLISTPRR